jgi:hypothetical protein
MLVPSQSGATAGYHRAARTARSPYLLQCRLGLDVPAILLARADEMIE